MDLFRQQQLLATYRDGLLNDTLPFWIKHCIDREHGGFITSLDQDGQIVDTDKGVWQQARFTWLLGELHNTLSDDPARAEWLELAMHGALFMDRHCFDASDGRMWFHLTREGQPLRKRRYAFSESFAAIAYGELFAATGQPEFREKAERCFHQFIDHNTNQQGVPKFTDVRPTRGLGVPMIGIATAQELRDSIGLTADSCIDGWLHDIETHHVKHDLQAVMETVGPSGQLIDHFDGRTLNPGHAIEGAWFVLREGQHRSDQRLIDLGCKMLDYTWARGWDQQHGGILYFVDVRNLPVQEYWHEMKFWWPQCEAIIATLLAYHLTGNSKYADWHRQIHDWTYTHFPDPKHGEWFGYLRRDGSVSSTLKGGLWKGPFHMPRMQLVCWRILAEMQ